MYPLIGDVHFFTNATGKMLVTVLIGLLNPFLEWEDLPVWTFCFLVSGSDPEENKGLPKSCGVHPEGLFCSLLWFLNCLHNAELVMSWLQAQEADDSLSPQRADTPPSPRFRVKGTLFSSLPCSLFRKTQDVNWQLVLSCGVTSRIL